MIIFLNIAILAAITGGVWWLTGIDKTAGGESKRDHHLSRAIRCISILFLAAVFLLLVESPMGYAGVPLLIIIPMCTALVLRSSLAEFFTDRFLGLVDPTLHDYREFDVNKTRCHLDTLSHLIHNGRKDEAIKLCEELKKSGEVELVTLEMTLEFLGVKQERLKVQRPVTEAARLRREGKFGEAELLLSSVLLKNPRDLDAAMMLVRLYAQDFHRPDKAAEVLSALEKQPHISKDHIEFARRSIHEWNAPQRKKSETVAPPESVDELLAQKFFGTAIEKLEEQIARKPQDFDSWMKLAEVHAIHLDEFPRAEKIVQQLETDNNFTASQIASARARLKEWRETPLQRK